MASAIASTTIQSTDDTLSSGGRLVSADGRQLPLVGTKVIADARGGIARVILEQRFVNPHSAPLNVSYALPLPAEGAVSGFAFEMDGRRVVGEVDTRVKARDRFERAIASGRTAALLEQQRTNQFHQQVGNVPPNGEILCEVVVDQKLTWLGEEGGWEWRFPTVVGPRYMGKTGRVRDAAALNVPYVREDTGIRTSLELHLRDAIPGGHAPRSTSHPLTAERVGSEHRIRFGDAAGVRLDRDIVVRWRVATPDVGVSLDTARPSDDRHADGDAYGLMTLVPPESKDRAKAMARDLIFLIDTSGSMGGPPLEQAKRVVCAMIDSLAADDRLEMIEFSSSPRRWKSSPVVASRDGKRDAIKWVKRLSAGGGTEMTRAVLEALSPLRPDAQRQVVLITDGYIGFENEIVRTVVDQLPRNTRLHTIGVGSAPNRSLTGPAARAGGGVEVIVGYNEDVEPAAKRLLERTVAPLVTDLSIEGEGVVAVPARLPDLFAGCPVLISLRLPADGTEIRVRGTTADGPWTQHVRVERVVLGAGNPGITALFGRERIEDLEARRAAAGSDLQEIDEAVEKTGLQFQVACRLTSWVAVDEVVSVEPGDKGIDEVVPHEIPYGTSIEGFGLRAVGAVAAPAGAMQRLRRPARPRPPRKKMAEREQFRAPPPAEAFDEAEGEELDELADVPAFEPEEAREELALHIEDEDIGRAEAPAAPAPAFGGEIPASYVEPEPSGAGAVDAETTGVHAADELVAVDLEQEAPARRRAPWGPLLWILLGILLGLILLGLLSCHPAVDVGAGLFDIGGAADVEGVLC